MAFVLPYLFTHYASHTCGARVWTCTVNSSFPRWRNTTTHLPANMPAAATLAPRHLTPSPLLVVGQDFMRRLFRLRCAWTRHRTCVRYVLPRTILPRILVRCTICCVRTFFAKRRRSILRMALHNRALRTTLSPRFRFWSAWTLRAVQTSLYSGSVPFAFASSYSHVVGLVHLLFVFPFYVTVTLLTTFILEGLRYVAGCYTFTTLRLWFLLHYGSRCWLVVHVYDYAFTFHTVRTLFTYVY